MLRTGWTHDQLDEAPAAVVAAMRWALYAEALWPERETVAYLDGPEPEGLEPKQRVALGRGRLALAEVRRALHLTDDEATNG